MSHFRCAIVLALFAISAPIALHADPFTTNTYSSIFVSGNIEKASNLSNSNDGSETAVSGGSTLTGYGYAQASRGVLLLQHHSRTPVHPA